MKDDMPGNVVFLREYVERILDEREKAVDKAFKSQQEALLVATRTLELRLEKLNELREEVTRDRGAFITREAFDMRIGQMGDTVRAVERRQSWMMGMGSLLVVLSGVVGAVVGFFAKR